MQKKLGPAWTELDRPPAGYFMARLAEEVLRRTLDEALGRAGLRPLASSIFATRSGRG